MEQEEQISRLDVASGAGQSEVLPWDERLAVGLPEIDAEHRQLVKLLNQLGSLRARGAGEEDLCASITALRHYFLAHFQNEFSLMERYAVSDAHRQLHLNAHQGFVDCLDSVSGLISFNLPEVVDHLLVLLVQWLTFHINNVDRRLAQEIIALRTGVAPDQSTVEENTFENTLVDTMNNLYSTLSKRTFELVYSNIRLQQSRDDVEQLQSRRILDALDQVVWSTKPGTHESFYINPAAEKIYGHPTADFIASRSLWFSLVHPDDRQRISDLLLDITEKGVVDIVYRIVRPDGAVRWIHDHIHVIYDEKGKAVSLNGLGTDITEHKLAEIELQQSHEELQAAYRKLQDAQNQLLQSEKMASIGQLAAGVAHEINNPIGYVYSNLGSLQKYLEDLFAVVEQYEKADVLLARHPEVLAGISAAKKRADLAFLKEDTASLMSECREGITRVKKIVQDLKDFSHVGSEEDWQWSDLRKGLDSTLNIVWNELKYKCEVIKEYTEIPDIECLPSQLNQVFMNLLVNSAHAIEEKGTITIRTGALDDKVWVEIADTGKGIAPEYINRIFEPFFTTKPAGKGTGLGLSLSYGIMEKHHGNIEVESEVGKGTTFRVVLSVKQPEATPETADDSMPVA